MINNKGMKVFTAFLMAICLLSGFTQVNAKDITREDLIELEEEFADPFYEGSYTKTTEEDFLKALENADEVVNAVNPTQEQLNNAYASLLEAHTNLYSTDHSDVKYVGLQGEVLDGDYSIYVFDAWGSLEDSSRSELVYPGLNIQGFYRVGEEITLTAVDIENATFQYWELLHYNSEGEGESLDGDTYNEKTHTFKVQDSDFDAVQINLIYRENGSITTKEMYRLYNSNSGEHFYTSSPAEKNNLVSLGWKDEGKGWTAPETGNPVYRLYNANGGEHHYTLSAAEKDALVKAGWKDEGIGWYSPSASDANVVPLYREYNPNAYANNHNYTTSKAEHDMLIGLGWKDEGTAWYGVKN